MSLVALISDTHYGARGDNPHFYNYQKKFIQNVFLPYLKKYDINHVVHLGDLVENRRQLNIQTGARLREDFLEPLDALDIDVNMLAGNHDVFYRSTNSINILNEITKQYYNFKMHTDLPTHINIDGAKILLVPWISPENKVSSLEIIKNSDAKYCMGHLELKGFEQTKGRISINGEDKGIFGRFDSVFSGHYHIRSHGGNVFYIGSAFHFNWGDCNNFCGFMVLDTASGKMDWIKNPYKIFTKLEYDESNICDIRLAKDTYCRVNVVNKISEAKFNDFINSIHELGVIDLLVDEKVSKIEVNVEEDIEVNDDSIFKKTIETLDFPYRSELLLLADEIQREAINL